MRATSGGIPARLPFLEHDGQTVRIDSNRDYQRIYDTYLCHGVLPVRGGGLRAQERRSIRFRICGLELNIELTARVRSVDAGVAILMVHRIDRHRLLLASLARDVPVLV